MAETAGHKNLSGDDSSVSDVEGKQDHSTIEVTPANKTEAPTNTGKEKKTRKKKNKMTTSKNFQRYSTR